MSVPKIFYDGCNLKQFANYSNVVGFTTNTTIMRQSNQLNYKNFYNENKDLIAGRPISFQVFSDVPEVIMQQAKQIHMLGSNIFVKVPVINTQGLVLLDCVTQLQKEGIQINITAIFTKQQLDQVQEAIINTSVPTIVSVFGGRISDTGVNPKDIIAYAVHLFKSNPLIEVLWAGCKDNLVVQNANDVGCHIITLPDAIISRINRLGQSLDNLSQDTVKSFLKDAIEANLQIE